MNGRLSHCIDRRFATLFRRIGSEVRWAYDEMSIPAMPFKPMDFSWFQPTKRYRVKGSLPYVFQ